MQGESSEAEMVYACPELTFLSLKTVTGLLHMQIKAEAGLITRIYSLLKAAPQKR